VIYQPKSSPKVRAFQFTGQHHSNLPDFFRKLATEGREGTFTFTVTDASEIWAKDGPTIREAETLDWIVWDGSEIRLMRNDAFAANYEKVSA
jgi:hypothetical protein